MTGAARDAVFLHAEDARALGLAEGDPVLLTSESGEYRGRAKIASIRPRNLQVHWPEGNVLLKQGLCESQSGVPDYNALVRAVPLRAPAGPRA